ncbi:ATP-binding cassette domain-containing protein, partial [Thalassospira lucentensis]
TNTDKNPLVEMRDIHVSFGGVKAVDGVSIDLYPGEVVGVLGHNGAGKSTLIKILSGAYQADTGQIVVDGKEAKIENARDARDNNIETIYQNLALADNLDATQNLFLGREFVDKFGFLDDAAMEHKAREVLHRLNPNFKKFTSPVSALSGGQRQSVAIARALLFEARVLIMDEPCAALGVHETKMVCELINKLKHDGLGILLISHDLHDVFDLSDRLHVMKNGKLVGSVRTEDVTHDDVLGMIILGKMPEHLLHLAGPGATNATNTQTSETLL